MSSDIDVSSPWKRLEEWADLGDVEHLQEETENLGARESARAISRLSVEQQNRVLTLLGREAAAELMEEIPEAQAVELLKHLPASYSADILEEMQSADTADLLGDLDDDLIAEILQEMDAETAAEARRLVSYPTDVAGGLMITEYLSFPVIFTARQVIDDMRSNADEYSEYSIQYTYVTDVDGKLLGVLPLRDLLLTPANTPLEKIMIGKPLSVRDYASLDELSEFFDEHDFLGVPVVDTSDVLVGILRRRDLREALGDKAQTDYLKAQGIVGGEELRSMPVLERSKRRLSWLGVNILLNVIGAGVIAMFEDTLTKVIALTMFLPMISDMSGCSGNQAVAVTMRELSLGILKPLDVMHVFIKEVRLGLINAVVLGITLALLAWMMKGNPYLGLVVGGSLALNLLIAVSLGGVIPLILKRMKFDPALASGPLLTTTTDMCGFFIVLSLATFFLPHLVTTT